MQNERPNAIIQNTIWKELLKYFFPILLGTFFQQLYNIVDASIVGHFVGDAGLAAVGGPSMTIINLFLGFFVGLGSGATVVVAQHYGAKDAEGTGRAVHTVVALSLAAGAILMVAGTLLSRAMLVGLNTPPEVLAGSTMFLRVYFLGIESVLFFNIGSGILRAVGDSRRPLVYLIIGSAVNIGMDFLLVVYFRLGVMGAALATLTAQTCAASLLVIRLMRVNDCYRLNVRRIGFDRGVLLDAFRIGLPAGFQSTMYGISNLLIQGGINSFGTTTVAAWTAYGKIDSMFWMTVSALGISVTTFVSQNFGARKMDRVRVSVRTGYLMAMGAALAISTVVWFFAEPFISFFTTDAEVIRTGARLLREITPLYFTYVSIEILSGALRGTGDSLIPMAMTVFGICGLRLFWLYVVFPLFPTMDALVFSYPVTWAATSLLFIAYYLRGGWLRRRQLAIGA